MPIEGSASSTCALDAATLREWSTPPLRWLGSVAEMKCKVDWIGNEDGGKLFMSRA